MRRKGEKINRTILYLSVLAAPFAIGQEIDFGDDSGNYPNDGECDDSRFEGPGAYTSPLDEDVLRDASDCLALFDSGQVWLAGEGPALFGALAIGEDLGYGGIVSTATQRDADAAALSECGSVDSDCEIVARFGADTCVAVARDDEAGWIGWATGPDSQETNDAAISECMAGGGSSCAVGDFACNGATAGVAATDSAERTRFAYAIGETGATDDQIDVCTFDDTIFVYWCWSELQSHPGCFFWVDQWMELRDAMATWTGQCVDGRTNGNGTLAWTLSVGSYNFTGGFIDGKRSGHWVERRSDFTSEGAFVDGWRHGRWVTRYADGSGLEVIYENGEAVESERF